MKKIISLFLFAVTVLSLTFSAFAEDTVPSSVIVETVYPTEDVVIADIIVTNPPYNADSSGETDVTAIIQKAIDDCASGGGGTVFLPVGKYKVSGNIYIRQFVTLRGDWNDPDISSDVGTLIIADTESSSLMTPGLFTVGASAGAVGLAVWYPNQSIDNVLPYPYTFYVTGNGDYMLHTIKNCTLINSYRGIGACSECENGVYQCHEMSTVENVKGTCLYEGLNSHNSADVDTVKTLYILNKYWANAGKEFNAPDIEKINLYTRKNGTGLIIGDLEWPQFADVKISDMQYGILMKKGIRYSFSGVFTDLYIENCDYGIYIPKGIVAERGLSWGTGIYKGVIEGSEYAVFDPGKAAMILTDVEVIGKIKGRNIRSYETGETTESVSYTETYSKPSLNLYTVVADKTGKTDASASVQQALDSAKDTGGVVYLPGGLYRFENPVTVPDNVELRGSSSVATRCQSNNSSGTLILSYYGYTKDSDPLITLKKGSGLNGIRIDYPLNNPVDDSGEYLATSPAIYSDSDNIYINNCYVTLASCGVKLENSDNVFLKKIIGCCYESMFSLNGCNDAFIEGCLQNANTLPRNGYASFGIPRLTEDKLFDFVFIPITRIHTNYIELSDCRNVTVFNSFIYGGKSFLKSTDSDVTLVNVGLDGSSKTEYSYILSGGNVNLVNSMRSTSDGKLGYKFFSAANGTKFRSFASQAVDMSYKEHVVLEGFSFEELNSAEKKYYILQPLYKILSFFGALSMYINEL